MAGLLQYTASPAPRGDYGVGYSLMLLIFGGRFFIFSGLLPELPFANGLKQDPLEDVLYGTASFQYPFVREKALADLKSRPDWEEELFEMANDPDECPTVYLFLECDPVPNPGRYVEPIKNDLRRRAAQVRKRLEEGGSLDKASISLQIHLRLIS